MAKKVESDGLSLWYRFTWRVKYIVLTFYGPPRLAGRLDPITRLEQDRAAKVAEARAARGGAGTSSAF
ncbi:hypothetical protein FB476_0955 [Ornithinimicrobium humiphilum]|jgi:hypothetical protein|uniref:Uncharacterized protein n=1 Tax=Ornithinimicrobium humiphilum TaxID=125288 RepID=A0A543KLY7_9MICO|nr:hypothetical protein [Ornithinimicrobium humiphilum]TQM96095.1 hypothetical protein FB476_0955 [Ornithinimicrobium humiphilum]